MKYIAYREPHILMVSNHFLQGDYQVMPLPKELEQYTAEDLILNFQTQNGKFLSKKMKKEAKDLRVAIVTNWKMACGIATYAEHLVEKLWPKLGEARLFIEQQESYTGELEKANGWSLPTGSVVACWERGKSLLGLVEEIKKFAPDVVLINHEWGLFPNARYWLSMITQLHQFRVITIMHSTFYHQDKTIVEASLPEIVVHQEGGKQVLEKIKEVSGKIYMIPHGCYEYQPGQLWNFYRTPQTFIQMGFGLRYKKFEDCIRATALLKDKYPQVYFTGIFSESPYAKVDHQIYFNELMALVKELSVEENVGIVRGFQSDSVIDSYLRTNAAAVFPYGSTPGHEVWGSSGAARLAMSRGLPVITADHNHFRDLPTLKAQGPEELAQMLDKLFGDAKFKKEQLVKQEEFLKLNSWEVTAEKFVEILGQIL